MAKKTAVRSSDSAKKQTASKIKNPTARKAAAKAAR
jgi:hypothetical protein